MLADVTHRSVATPVASGDTVREGSHETRPTLTRQFLRGARLAKAHCLTREQVFNSFNHGQGAFLPPDWPADWRERLEQSAAEALNPTSPSSTSD